MAWHTNKWIKLDPDDFDPNGEYTADQLDAYATAMLYKDHRENKDEDVHILFDEKKYSGREIPVNALEIDGTLTQIMQDPNNPGVFKGDNQRMYNRSHPLGRRVNDETARKEKGASYYKG